MFDKIRFEVFVVCVSVNIINILYLLFFPVPVLISRYICLVVLSSVFICCFVFILCLIPYLIIIIIVYNFWCFLIPERIRKRTLKFFLNIMITLTRMFYVTEVVWMHFKHITYVLNCYGMLRCFVVEFSGVKCDNEDSPSWTNSTWCLPNIKHIIHL